MIRRVEQMTMETDEFQEAISDLSEEKANIVVAFLTNAVNDAKEKVRKQTLEEVLKIVDAKYPDGMYSGEILNKLSEWLEQKLKAME